MCGILGEISEAPIEADLFVQMRDTLRHRGPDGAGCWFSENRRVALGHRRLAIIDLSERGAQPMSNEDGTVWITYNGEIYNFQELREALEAKGHVFRSQSDTEVIVHGYEEWGEGCVERLRGMFAFGLWDEPKRQLVLATDPFRIKPLYYYRDEHRFLFASELKAIVAHPGVPREIDVGALCDYLYYRYVPAPKGIWKNSRKLPPASVLVYRDGRVDVRRYWEPPVEERPMDEGRALEELDALLDETVRLHQVSDVPIGLFLSGGTDSSTIAYYMHRQGHPAEAFSIGFESDDPWYDERPHARQVAALYCRDLHEEVARAAVWELLPTLMWHYDEPFSGSSMFPTYMVSKMTSRHVKVALSGDGGDELFAGYHRYFAPGARPTRRPIAERLMHRLLPGKDTVTPASYFSGFVPFMSAEDIAGLLHPDLVGFVRSDQAGYLERHFRGEVEAPKRWQLLDASTILPEHYLTKIDRASMANSLEVRVPFLDKRLAEFAFSLPRATYLRRRESKYLLKRLMRQRLPAEVLHRKKRGFSMPLGALWDLKHLRAYVLDGAPVRQALFLREFVERLGRRRVPGDTWRLWSLCVFSAWYETWCGNRPCQGNAPPSASRVGGR